MMLELARSSSERDLTSLRCMFTGGEAVPYERAARFEDVTGARVLQFYGSNETGALSNTTLERRPRAPAAAPPVGSSPRCSVRLLDDDGDDITEPGVPGNPVCKGAATCFGYLDDDAANEELYHDGRVDAHRRRRARSTPTATCASSVGRPTSSSAAARTSARLRSRPRSRRHPAIAVAAAVSMPDEIFGERVCLYVGAHAGASSLDARRVVAYLARRGVSTEWFPERLVVVDALPRASGGKVAKGELRADIRRRLDDERIGPSGES